MDKLSVIDKYLRELGVNENIINYMRENKIYLFSYFEDTLGKDFYMFNDEYHKEEFHRKLKFDSQNLRIFDNGSIWFSTTTDPKIETGPAFARNKGFLSLSRNMKYDEIKLSEYISFENGNIIRRKARLEKQIKDNQTYYDGSFDEEIKGVNSKDKIRKSASFMDSTMSVPTEALLTGIEHINELGLSERLGNEKLNYNNSLWHLTCNGKIKNQNLIENLNSERISSKDKFRLVKQNIFAKVKARNQTNLFKQLREQCMKLLINGNPDEIIHSEFSMRGKEGEICTWTLEKVTELSRDTIFQMDFKNTEQFREQMLHPSLVDYAQTNSIIRGSVNPTDTGSFQYRAFSTTNNVITINNVSQEYANYISKEIQRVEPIIYDKLMEQKEKENQQANGLGYQKINKLNSGFFDVLFLASIVGYILGLMLFIMLVH